jgi:chromosomal replication initiation ATPase DnaA
VVQVISTEFDCDCDSILLKGIKRNPARNVAIYLCREMTGETGVSLGRYFGGVTGAAITIKHGQVANRIGTDRKLKGRIVTAGTESYQHHRFQACQWAA